MDKTGGHIDPDPYGDEVNQVTNSPQRAGATTCPLCDSKDVTDFLIGPDRFHMRTELYRLKRCSACACVWLVDPPLPLEMAQHYDEDYHRTIMLAGEGSSDLRWHGQRERIAKYKRAGAILDIGCSSGGFLSTMKSPAWKLHGIEMAPATAERARKSTGGEIFTGDAVDAPFAAGSFDVITTFDVLEHVYQPRSLVAKIHQWLKPGGIYYTMIPNIDSWEARLMRSYWYGLELPRHLFHFSPKSLAMLMKSHNFATGEFQTTRTAYLEHSSRYVVGSIVNRLGGRATPLARAYHRSFLYRAGRKIFRLALVNPFAKAAAKAEAGASIEAVFIKPETAVDAT